MTCVIMIPEQSFSTQKQNLHPCINTSWCWEAFKHYQIETLFQHKLCASLSKVIIE